MKSRKFLILLVLTALTLSVVACGPKKEESGPTGDPSYPSGGESYPSSGIAPGLVERISPAEGKAAYDSGQAVFLDVRSAESYAQAHIPGALSIPVLELENRLGELNPSQWVITYCT